MSPFLNKLAIRLALGAEHWDETVRRESADFFWSAQDESGGFVGRRGTGDLYYTGFALRGLALLGCLTDSEQTRGVEQFLLRSLNQSEPLRAIDVLSLLFSSVLLELTTSRNVFAVQNGDRRDWAMKQIGRFQAQDGGFVSSGQTPHSSTYHTFLVYAGLELLGSDLVFTTTEECRNLLQFLLKRQRKEGGFAELALLPQGGTNPTTAAISLLSLLREKWLELEEVPAELLLKLDHSVQQGIAFLKQQLVPTSGFRAHARIPVPDLLSTFTSLLILLDTSNIPLTNRSDCSSLVPLSPSELCGIRSFVESLKRPQQGQGGFAGGVWDQEPDVEFTFYGLGTLALLEEEHSL